MKGPLTGASPWGYEDEYDTATEAEKLPDGRHQAFKTV